MRLQRPHRRYKDCPPGIIRALRPESVYRAEWFDPRSGAWSDAGSGWLHTDVAGIVKIPALPSDIDWGLRLEYAGPGR